MNSSTTTTTNDNVEITSTISGSNNTDTKFVGAMNNNNNHNNNNSIISISMSDSNDDDEVKENNDDNQKEISNRYHSITPSVQGFPYRQEESNEDNNMLENNNENEIQSVCGFTYPWSPDWCLSVIGSEYCHSYFWIAKDLAWTQGWRFFALFYGSAAILWWGIIAYHSLRTKNPDEIWNSIALFLWLFANFWWMAGEAHDHAFPDAISVSDIHTDQSARMLESALIWLLIYYLIILPFNLFPASPEAIAEYDDGEYIPRFSYFKNYRQYENVHMLFWCAKDLAWNRNNISMWFVFLWPTILVAADFLYISAFYRHQIVDTVHYAATLMWVSGNMTWALGEFFFGDYDEPLVMWYSSKEALKTARWYSSWILFSALLTIFLLYCVWIPVTCSGKLSKINNTNTNTSTSIDKSLRKQHHSHTSIPAVDIDAMNEHIEPPMAPRNHLKYAEDTEELFLLIRPSDNNSNKNNNNNNNNSSSNNNSNNNSRKSSFISNSDRKINSNIKSSNIDDGELR